MAKKGTILIVDDERGIRELCRRALKETANRVLTAGTGKEALRIVKKESHPDIVILDVRLPGMDGIELLQKIKQINSRIIVILITGYGTMESTIRAMKLGAYDFVNKPFSLEVLKKTVENAVKRKNSTGRAPYYKPFHEYEPHDIVGENPQLRKIYKLIGKVADTAASILIQGETGTGKELVARALHRYSKRNEKPFIALDCASLPPTLLESELFGHEKGSFTGAINQRLGKFELASGGTLFLDEIGNLSLATQASLLRAIQEREIVRIGGAKPIKVNVRIISATSQNLEEMVKKKTFREDLYYRLNVVPIYLPPLRERKDDIPLLIKHSLKKFGSKARISSSVVVFLKKYHWPGNVRELENIVQRLVVMSRDGNITEEDLPPQILNLPKESKVKPVRTEISDGSSVDETIADLEKRLTLEALEENGFNQKKAAVSLGISPRSLRYRIKKYQIKK